MEKFPDAPNEETAPNNSNEEALLIEQREINEAFGFDYEGGKSYPLNQYTKLALKTKSGNTYHVDVDSGTIINQATSEKHIVPPNELSQMIVYTGIPFHFGQGNTSTIEAVQTERSIQLKQESGGVYAIKDYNYLKLITEDGDEMEYFRSPGGYFVKNTQTGASKFIPEDELTSVIETGSTTVSIGGKVSRVASVVRISGDYRTKGDDVQNQS